MRTWEKARRGYNGCTMPIRNPAKRAKWPYGLSQAVREATIFTYNSETKQ